MSTEFNIVKEYENIMKADITCDESIEELLRDSEKYQDRFITLIFVDDYGFYTFDEAVNYIVNYCDKKRYLIKGLLEVLEETETISNELC